VRSCFDVFFGGLPPTNLPGPSVPLTKCASKDIALSEAHQYPASCGCAKLKSAGSNASPRARSRSINIDESYSLMLGLCGLGLFISDYCLEQRHLIHSLRLLAQVRPVPNRLHDLSRAQICPWVLSTRFYPKVLHRSCFQSTKLGCTGSAKL
jgi:hypothetical protein